MARPRILQRIHRLGDIARAAEEHRRVLGAERSQPAEGRALGVDRPQHGAALEDLLLEPGPQQLLDFGLELVGALEGMEGELELAVLRLEPGLEEALQPVPLLADELIGGLVVELDGGRLAVAEDIDVGDGFRLARLDRREDLVGGARRVALAVRQGGEIVGELGAEPMAQDGDDEIALGGLGDLLLEGGARLVIFGLPADGLERGHAGKLAVQALDHALNAHALEMRVAGRGDEDANGFHGRRVIRSLDLQDQLLA